MNKKFTNQIHYNLMLIPGVIMQILFCIIPMVGIVMAFQRFNPAKGFFSSQWVGLDNFKYMLQVPDIRQILFNTIFLAIMKIIGNLLVALIFALLLNELKQAALKRIIQTVVYIPHFISWVLLSAIFLDLFSVNGIFNKIIGVFGIHPVMFLTSNQWFRPIMIGTDVWKEFGFSAIIFLAALTGISPELYEASDIDGATRLQKLWYVTLPGLKTTIILLLVLSLGDIMNANFDQIFNMYNPLVYKSADIIDTYVYRVGLQNTQYGFATAVGLLKSVVSFIMIVTSYKMADKFANYKIF